MPNITYTTLSSVADAERLAAIFDEVFETPRAGVAQQVEKILSDTSVCVLGGFVDGELVGGLVAYELPLLRGEEELYLYDIAVLPQFQKRGIGTGLLGALKEEAKRRGATTIFVGAEADDEGAVAFYRACGGEEMAVRHFNFAISVV